MLGITTDRSRYRRTNSPTGATGPTATRAVTATDWAATDSSRSLYRRWTEVTALLKRSARICTSLRKS